MIHPTDQTTPDVLWAGGVHACLERRHDSPTMIVNGEPVPPMWMTISSLAAQDEAYVRALGEAGIRTFFLCHRLLWNGPDALEALRRDAEMTLRAVPEAWLILRTEMYPPAAWMDAHPDEIMQLTGGIPAEPWYTSADCKVMQCLASRRWREDQAAELDRLLEWMAEQPFAERVIGFFLNAGGTGEWYVPAHTVYGDQTTDHSPAFRTQFAATLRETYGDDDTLRAAWKMPEATIDNPPIPAAADHAFLAQEVALFAHYHGEDALPPAPPVDAAIGPFINPDTHRFTADFYRALNQGSADSIISFARHLKARTGGMKIVGSFYGGFGPATHGSASEHTRVLDSGVVDFLASPGDYVNRKPGGDVALHNMLDSYRLRDKLFVLEEDTRTFAMNPCPDWGVNTLAESIEVMKRDFGRSLAEDLTAWWFDMAWHERRWYRFPKMQAMIQRQQQVAHTLYARPRAPQAEIAFLYDQESLLYTGNWTLADLGHRLRSWEMHRIGAPVAYHYLEDLEHPAMPDYKLYVFVNAFVLDDHRRALIAQFLHRQPCTALWLYAPGIIHPDRDPRFAVENVTALTGVQTGCLLEPALPYCRLTPEGAQRLPDARADWDYGWFTDRESSGTVESWLQPQGLAQFSLLYPYLFGDDPNAEVLLRFNADDRPAMVMAEHDGLRTINAYIKAPRAELFRGAARLAGCHIYNTSDDILYASPHFVTLHASVSGEKVIQLPSPVDPYEIYEQRSYGTGITELRFILRKGETRTFYLHGEI